MIDPLEYEKDGLHKTVKRVVYNKEDAPFQQAHKDDIRPEIVKFSDNPFLKEKVEGDAFMRSTEYKKVDSDVFQRSDYRVDALMTDPVKLVGYEEAKSFEEYEDTEFSAKTELYLRGRSREINSLDHREGIPIPETFAPSDSSFLNTNISLIEDYRMPLVKFR